MRKWNIEPVASWRHCLHQKLYEQQRIFEVHGVRSRERKGILQHIFFSEACMQHKEWQCLRLLLFLKELLLHSNSFLFPLDKMILMLVLPLLCSSLFHLPFLWINKEGNKNEKKSSAQHNTHRNKTKKSEFLQTNHYYVPSVSEKKSKNLLFSFGLNNQYIKKEK